MNFPKIPYYHILDVIQEGGTAIVYDGIDLRSGYEVAIKALFPERAKDAFIMQRFKEEANYYLHLSHPNITRLIDFVEDGNRVYLIMEFIDGISLSSYIKDCEGKMPTEILISLFRQILETIAYIHQHWILHLDIKPSNMMVQEGEKIKILDMGISARLNDKENNAKKCGSPAFMAPEQINRGELGMYTDIFALGVTLFNMLTGHLPFVGKNYQEIFDAICNAPTPKLEDYSECVIPGMQKIIDKALSKEGKDRYMTCEEFEYEFLSVFENENNKDRKRFVK